MFQSTQVSWAGVNYFIYSDSGYITSVCCQRYLAVHKHFWFGSLRSSLFIRLWI
jgi:hypothetical protein